MVDLDETLEGLKQARRIKGNIMRNQSIDPSLRLKAIKLDVVLLTTILKIKYEGKSIHKRPRDILSRNLGNFREKRKRNRKSIMIDPWKKK